jgi:dihydrofolate reductase
MRRLTSILAVNNEGVIGVKNTLPWRIRTDMRFFKRETRNNVVIMGRKTFDSLGKPLPDRHNIVVTHNLSLFEKVKGCVAVCSIEEALYKAYKAPLHFKEIFVVGGATMYSQFAPYVDRYLVTIVDKRIDDPDVTKISDRLFEDFEGVESNPTVLQRGEPNFEEGDEAGFEIREFTARDPEVRRERRLTAIKVYHKRIEQNQPFKLMLKSDPHEPDGPVYAFGF